MVGQSSFWCDRERYSWFLTLDRKQTNKQKPESIIAGEICGHIEMIRMLQSSFWHNFPE